MKLYPLLFEPNLHKVVWGGNQLRPYKGMEPSDEPIGESWEVSAVPTSTSITRIRGRFLDPLSPLAGCLPVQSYS